MMLELWDCFRKGVAAESFSGGDIIGQRKQDRHSGNMVADIFSVSLTTSLLQNKLVDELVLL